MIPGVPALRTLRLLVPSPALPNRLDRFVVANVPELSRRQVKGLLNAEQVRVNGRTERRAGRKLRTGEVVELNYRPSLQSPADRPAELLIAAQGEQWWVVRKPAGLSSHPSSEDDHSSIAQALARTLGLAPGDATAVHRLDRGTSGLLLVARAGTERARLSQLFEERLVRKVYLAVVHPAPAESDGRVEGPEIDGRSTELNWTLLRRSADGTRAELQVEPTQGRTHQVRIQLATAGWPIVGDLDYGEPLPGGSPRMALHCASLSWDDCEVSWPTDEDWELLLEPGPAEDTAASDKGANDRAGKRSPGLKDQQPTVRTRPPGVRELVVSRSSARILAGGHPWLIADRWTGDMGGIKPGEMAWLVDERGQYVATAVIDPTGSPCGRVISRDAGELVDEDSLAQRASSAIRRRQDLLDDPTTTAHRLIHGEADGLPGLTLDLWGEVLVATLQTPAARELAAAAYRGVQQQLGPLGLYERDHFTDLRRDRKRQDARLPGRWIHEPTVTPSEPWQVLERCYRFSVSPLSGLSSGLYPDQRDNRARVEALVAKQKDAQIANLFSHSGAFSVACAVAGAARVWSVDLSRPYGELARGNLEANGLSPDQHPIVSADASTWLRREASELDGVIIDPPSRASGRKAGERGWSSKRDYRSLVAQAAGQLRAGGWMLCCCNLRDVPRGWLGRELAAGLRAAGRRTSRPQEARAASDFPRLRGFPEGHSFDGLLVVLD